MGFGATTTGDTQWVGSSTSMWLGNWGYAINMELNLVIFELAKTLEQVLILGDELVIGGSIVVCDGLDNFE